jgi:retinol-binding protein 3
VIRRSGAAGPGRSASRLLVLAGLALTLAAAPALAQLGIPVAAPEARPLDGELRAAIIDSITYALNENYVFKDTAAAMEKHVRRQAKRGAYDGIGTVQEFAAALTRDLTDVSHDLHIGVRYYSDEDLRRFEEGKVDPAVARRRAIEQQRKQNFLFRKAEVLDGNVGYLRFDGFADADLAGATATAAMNFLGNVDAIIFDLRYNGGGSPSLIQYITAYLLKDYTHLNDFATRGGDSTQQFWTAPYVPGPKLTDADVYVLTSDRTFSGAEEFTYNLKNLERATIIGDTTGGGAHPVNGVVFPTLNVGISVPYARAVNPITGTNWEGTGVTPHIAVPADEALDVAYLEALKKIEERTTDAEEAASLSWAIDGLESKRHPASVDPPTLERYAGSYGPRKLYVEDGRLYYQREGRAAAAAVPMTETVFRFDGIDYFRLEVVLDDQGRPTKVIGHYNDGHTDESPRTEGD